MTTALEQRLKGSWKQVRGRIKETWGALTDDDLDRADGRLDQLVGSIESRTGEKRQEIRRKLDDLLVD